MRMGRLHTGLQRYETQYWSSSLGGLSMDGLTFWETLSESLGFKTGLTLDQSDIVALLESDPRFTHIV